MEYCCCSVVSNSLWPHRFQNARLPCPSPSLRACSNSCPMSQWYHPIILSFVITFSSCLQSFPAPGSFLMSWLSTSGGQSTGASASVLLMNIYDWFPLRLTGLISLQSKGLSMKSLFQYHNLKASILQRSAFIMVQLSHPYMTSGKTTAMTNWIFLGKVISMLFFFFQSV